MHCKPDTHFNKKHHSLAFVDFVGEIILGGAG